MDLSELERSLRKALWLNKSTLACLCQVILGLVNYRTVDLAQIAAGLQGKALLSSKQRRIQRLLKRWPEQLDWLGPWLLSWFYCQDEKVSLTMDRTKNPVKPVYSLVSTLKVFFKYIMISFKSFNFYELIATNDRDKFHHIMDSINEYSAIKDTALVSFRAFEI